MCGGYNVRVWARRIGMGNDSRALERGRSGHDRVVRPVAEHLLFEEYEHDRSSGHDICVRAAECGVGADNGRLGWKWLDDSWVVPRVDVDVVFEEREHHGSGGCDFHIRIWRHAAHWPLAMTCHFWLRP